MFIFEDKVFSGYISVTHILTFRDNSGTRSERKLFIKSKASWNFLFNFDYRVLGWAGAARWLPELLCSRGNMAQLFSRLPTHGGKKFTFLKLSFWPKSYTMMTGGPPSSLLECMFHAKSYIFPYMSHAFLRLHETPPKLILCNLCQLSIKTVFFYMYVLTNLFCIRQRAPIVCLFLITLSYVMVHLTLTKPRFFYLFSSFCVHYVSKEWPVNNG